MRSWLCAVLFMISYVGFGQRAHLDQADTYYKQRFYKEAIAEYKLALEEGVVVNKFYMTQQIARTYKQLFDYENAELWYSKLLSLGDDNVPENYLHYAQLLLNNQKYAEAELWFQKYIEVAKITDRKVQYLELTSWPQENQDSVWDINLYNTNIETGSRSMGIYLVNDKMFYAAPVINEFQTKTAFYDLAFVPQMDSINFGSTVVLPGEVNKSFYEGTPFVTQDGKYIYYTANATERTKYREKKREKKGLEISANGLNILKIYRATNVNGIWKNVIELNLNSNDYSCAFPHISRDGNTMYFASDQPGGHGRYDLYRASKINDSTWSAAFNLGPEINSDQDEMYPFTNDTAFFYSSKGKPGYGGADIYWGKIEGVKITQVQNIGIPLNSSKDDFSFITIPNVKGLLEGYLSTNREGTHGYDKVVYFNENPAPVYPDTIIGTALNKITLNPIQGVKIALEKYVDEIDLESAFNDETKKDGNITLILQKKTPYRVTFTKEGYKPITIEIPETERDDVLAKFGKISLEPVAVKNTIIKIPNIYFDFDKSSIREESFGVLENIVDYLNDNPEIRVELSAHTDARGKDWYNLNLSQRRAASTVDFLVKKGILKSRLVPKGYGEKKILNQCKNGVKCSDEEHELNRRVELKVL